MLGSFCKLLFFAFLVSLLFPQFLVYYVVLLDFHTSFDIMNSPLFEKYHNFIVSQLPLQPELPIPELQAGHFTKEDVMELSKGFVCVLL